MSQSDATAEKAVSHFLKDVAPNHLANAIRTLSMDAVQAANSGHPGMPMGMADAATVLFTRFLKCDPSRPHWPDRDRFVLSAGHGSMLQYAVMYLLGYEDITLQEIKNFRQWGAKTAGHPEYGHAAGIETTTGPLGQGLANAVGMALAERMQAARYGDAVVDHKTYVIAGDGCLMEGISQEAISLAGHLKLNKLILLWDDNQISIDGPTSLTTSENMAQRFTAAGWNVDAVDGHDPEAVAKALEKAQSSDKPVMIACCTTIGYGSPNKAGTSGSHGSPLGAEEITATRLQLEWPHAPFEIPQDILAQWRDAGKKSADHFAAWEKRFNALDEAKRDAFTRGLEGELTEGWQQAVEAFKKAEATAQTKEATRQSSFRALEALIPALPELVGGSADLTGSNLTKTKPMQPVTAKDYSGDYIYWGVREHGMAAAMNGMALHGGFVPYGGTFMVFTDYCRPAIRLSALMQQRVIYVMTHDSIGLGEDGPTHQPVEHLAALRAIPNLQVFRPADATETMECWALALASKKTPSILSLSRQATPALRKDYTAENHSAKGGYVISPAKGEAKATLISSGTEVALAVEAQAKLREKGIETAVVSLPSWELFAKQPAAYRKQVLGTGLRVGIEAAGGFGWERWIGEEGTFIGLQGFGASAPAPELYSKFGITVEAIVKAVDRS